MVNTAAHKFGWQLALSLSERLTGDLPVPPSTGWGERQIARSRNHYPFHYDAMGDFWWQQRLQLAQISTAMLGCLWEESLADLQRRYSIPPPWANWAAATATDPPSAIEQALYDRRDRSDLGAGFTTLVQSDFFELICPCIAQSLGSLEKQWSQDFSALPSHQWLDWSLQLLPVDLFLLWEKTLRLELAVADFNPLFTTATISDRRQCLLYLFQEYPLLARRTHQLLTQWRSFIGVLRRRLQQDWNDLADIFGFAAHRGQVKKWQLLTSDRHWPGQGVVLITLNQGQQWVYKPRSLATEAVFGQLISWANCLSLPQYLMPLTLLDRGSYGWMAYIENRPPHSIDEWQDWSWQLGAYQALFYRLGTTDLHGENCLCQGSQLFWPDLETLSEPALATPTAPAALFGHLPAHRTLAESVLRAGLLPQPRLGQAAKVLSDPSVLGVAIPKILDQTPLITTTNANSASMSDLFGSLRLEDPPGYHWLQKNFTAFLDGFHRLYHELQSAPHSLNGITQTPRVRVILRDTRVYDQLLQASNHPDFLRNALAQERLWERLWVEVPQLPYLQGVLAAEIAALQMGCIPRFTVSWGGTTLQADTPQDVFLEPSPLAQSPQNTPQMQGKRLGLEDYQQQQQILRQSWQILAVNHLPPLPPVRESSVTSYVYDPLALAMTLGQDLLSQAHHTPDYLGWLGPSLGSNRWVLAPAGWDLYNGLPGIAVFLAALHRVTAQSHYQEAAQRTLAALAYQVQHYCHQLTDLGLFTGWGGLVYTWSLIGQWWQEPSWWEQALRWSTEVRSLIDQDRHYDIIRGGAGCILGLLHLHQVTGEPQVLATAVMCGDHLCAQAQSQAIGVGWPSLADLPPLAGYGHGTSGIIHSLNQIDRVRQSDRYQPLIQAALQYERSLFAPDQNNWQDLRQSPPGFPCNWSHGATGIGWSRLALALDNDLQQEIDHALHTTLLALANPTAHNYSLGGGKLGQLLFLQALHHPALNDYCQQVWQEGCASQWPGDAPRPLVPLGLMAGQSGIGYGWLQLAYPDRLPNLIVPNFSDHA